MNPPDKICRETFWIDKEVQRRISLDLLLTLLTGGVLVYAFPVMISLLFGIYFTDMSMDEIWKSIVSATALPLLTVLLLLPLGLRHSIRFSNRIAGPMHRFKTEIRNLLNEEPVRRVHLRKNDFFKDYAEDFNRLVDMVDAYREKLEPGETPLPIASSDEPYSEGMAATRSPV